MNRRICALVCLTLSSQLHGQKVTEQPTSQIIFYRSGTIIGAALGCSVKENGDQLAQLGAGRYQALEFKPGRHTFVNRSGGLDVDLKPGERRYVACKIKAGFFSGTPSLSVSDEATFLKKLPSLKPTEENKIPL